MRRGMERDPQLLDLALELLLARATVWMSCFAVSPSIASPSSRARSTTHFGSSHGFGAPYSRTSPPPFSTALASLAGAFPRAIRTSTVSGGIAASDGSSSAMSSAFQPSTGSASR